MASRRDEGLVEVSVHVGLQNLFSGKVSLAKACFAFVYWSSALKDRYTYVSIVDEHHSSAGAWAACFNPTRWTVVLEAAQSSAPSGPQAMADLCTRYWPPLYVFARGRGRGPEDAQDLVQGFFEHLIQRRALLRVERSKGRFRSFLLASFQNFIAVETRRARTEKRGGRVEVVRLDWEDEEGRVRL